MHDYRRAVLGRRPVDRLNLDFVFMQEFPARKRGTNLSCVIARKATTL
jgi:hypothetical protein